MNIPPQICWLSEECGVVALVYYSTTNNCSLEKIGKKGPLCTKIYVRNTTSVCYEVKSMPSFICMSDHQENTKEGEKKYVGLLWENNVKKHILTELSAFVCAAGSRATCHRNFRCCINLVSSLFGKTLSLDRSNVTILSIFELLSHF